MKIIFVCHGNICRSVAAEVIAKEYILKNKILGIEVLSRALSSEEIGNDIYPPMKKVLIENGYHPTRHYATRLTQKEVDEADKIYYMDEYNKRLIEWWFPNSLFKFELISKYTDQNYISDPWYSGKFSSVFFELKEATEAIINHLK